MQSVLLHEVEREASLGGVSLTQVAREFGTPLFVFSGDALRARAVSYTHLRAHET